MSLMQMNYLYCGVLIVIGVAGYFLTNRVSVTALIPAIFGIVLAFVNYLTVQQLSPTLAIVGIVLTVIGMAGASRGVKKLVSGISGGGLTFSPALVSQLLFLVFCVLIIVTFWRMHGVLTR